MFKLAQRDTKVLLAIHGWSGVVLGLLLYAVICTGVAAVFATEISEWSSPLASRDGKAPIPTGLDDTVGRLARTVDPSLHEEIAIFSGGGGRLNLRYHRHDTNPEGKPDEVGVEYELDPRSFETLARREGWTQDLADQTRASGIADFLVDLHVRLHIPDPYGLFVTGVLGLAMMIAAITGLVIHRHLLVDLFTLRLARDALLRRRDLHVIAGSWNLPFALILAFTGSFFSFASSVGLPAIAMVKFGGDQEALNETLYGTATPQNASAAPLASVDAMVADARARKGAEPTFVNISHYGRADATVTIFTELPGDELVYSSYVYGGTDGRLIKELPPLGQTPSTGASIVGLMYPLHFGHFAGVVSKSAWVAMGFASAYVSLTGLLLWTRRRQEQPAWNVMARLVHYVGYGLPLALAGAPYAFFLFRNGQLPVVTSQGIAFLVIAAAALIATLAIKDLERLRRGLLTVTALAILGLPAVRLLSGGPSWSEAWRMGAGAVPAIDVALVVIACMCFWAARSSGAAPPVVAAAPDERGRQPA